MPVSQFFIYKTSVLYLVIPILFFFLGWLRLGIGILLSALLLLATFLFFKSMKNAETSNDFIVLTKEYFIAFIILFLFLLSTGNTGFLGCWSYDIPWRNAIYQDMIHQSWPVIYEYSHSMLCYYMAFWLVPAAISSWLNLGELGSNIVLLLWMYLGLILIFFLLCDILKPKKEYVVLVTILFLFFSGINMFGVILTAIVTKPDPIIADYPARIGWDFSTWTINGFHAIYFMRSIYLCIADIYNQFFDIAIVTLLFLKFRYSTEYYAFVGLLLLPYSPIGFIGVFMVELLEYIVNAIHYKELKSLKLYFKQSLSHINILTILTILPVFYLYFSMNYHATNLLTENTGESFGFLYVPLSQYNAFRITLMIMYYSFYFGIYARLLYEDFKKQSLYWIVLFCLIIIPFFRIGSGEDLNLNATIPSYLILLYFIIKQLLNALDNHCFRLKDLILVFCLSIAILTPVIQISTSFRGAYLSNSISQRWSPWNALLIQDSFRDKKIDGLRNFMSDSYENSLFNKYFAKK